MAPTSSTFCDTLGSIPKRAAASIRWTDAFPPTMRWIGLRIDSGVRLPVETSSALPRRMPRVFTQLLLTIASTCGICDA